MQLKKANDLMTGKTCQFGFNIFRLETPIQIYRD